VSVLVVGGAGFIGSHMLKLLAKEGFDALVVDNLATGHLSSVKYGRFVELDLTDRSEIKNLFRQNTIEAVMHFASSIEVAESVRNPRKYYENNLVNSFNLIDAVVESDVSNFLFSSSASVYLADVNRPLIEADPIVPSSPYGRTKRVVEEMLEDYRNAYGLGYCSLRYFNAGGADLDGELGELHIPESHLIPLCLFAAHGKGPSLIVNGHTYSTIDGTCVRDYVHVQDICIAHLEVLKAMLENRPYSRTYNIGTGVGSSILQVIRAVESVTGLSVPFSFGSARKGDPPYLVASSDKISAEIGWSPEYSSLECIVRSAHNFFLKNGVY
jgi:UDP-glucose 4-epimerase